MQSRVDFISEWLRHEWTSMERLCKAHGISRKTGYKWVGRFKKGGLPALEDRPRGCPVHPMATDLTMVRQVVAVRKKHPTWGPKKLARFLKERNYEPPTPSTIGRILRRSGLLLPSSKRRQPRPGDYSSHLAAQDRPNAVWAVDFKGWFRLGNGTKCYPLTISDGYSRFLLACDALEHPDELACREVFERVFAEYGLPEVIRSDNGTPFSGRFGISQLSVWWVQLGIRPERIQRGKPSQNGRHERMHRTLKRDAIQFAPLGFSVRQQQKVFDEFRAIYNCDRPHEALGLDTPASHYERSSKCYPLSRSNPRYSPEWEEFLVHTDGYVRLPDRELNLSRVLSGQPVGFEPLPEGGRRVHYGPLVLGTLSSSGKFTRGSRLPKSSHAGRSQDEIKLAETPRPNPPIQVSRR